jgi:hypothetical protein
MICIYKTGELILYILTNRNGKSIYIIKTINNEIIDQVLQVIYTEINNRINIITKFIIKKKIIKYLIFNMINLV